METTRREAIKGRKRVERGIYRQPNGKYVVCFMLDGKPRFRTVGRDLELARSQRLSFMRAARFGVVEFPRFSGHLMACLGKSRKDGVHAAYASAVP